MRRRTVILVGVLALGIGGSISSPIPSARADEPPQLAPIRRFQPHPQDSFHYTAGILTFAQGDIDGDTDIDIVGVDFYNAGGASSQLWLNDGTGYFSETLALPDAINSATSVLLVDLDSDDDLDMIVGRTEEQPELLAFNDGSGAFDRITEIDIGFTFHVIAADFNGDEHPDILAINEPDPDPFDPQPTDARERLWLNNGAGVFAEAGRMEFGNWADAFPGDIDGDQDLDLLVSNTSNAAVWRNDGAGRFSAAQQFPPEQGQVQAAGDFDGDGDIDTLGFPAQGEGLVLGRNNGAGVFAFERQALAGVQGGLLHIGDMDRDGDLDALRFGGWNEPFTVLSNDRLGHFTPVQTIGGGTVSRVLLADVNNDTWLDVLAGHNPHVSQNPSAPSVWLNEAVEIRGTLYLPLVAKP